ncbi:hypothetical protein BC941DRAFT_513726 [Chlamydoabsidia padenii]|nr:hypothetical protein BC941DRAFT_513726 [Chlamydoabsidia padenii]
MLQLNSKLVSPTRSNWTGPSSLVDICGPDEILSPPVTPPSFNIAGPSSSSSTSVINRTPTSNDKGFMIIGLMHLGLSFSYCQYYCNPEVTLHNLLYQRRNSSICGDELLAPPNHRLNLSYRQYFKRKYRITATWDMVAESSFTSPQDPN